MSKTRDESDARSSRLERTLRLGLGLAQRVSTPLAATAASRLFCTPRRLGRPPREVELLERGERFALGPDLLAAWKWGHGPVVALVHGWEGRGAQLFPFVQPLVDAGFSVVTFDAPAHGSSPGQTATLMDWATALLAIERRFGKLHGAIAHSLGTSGLGLALGSGLHLDSCVLIGPAPATTHTLRQYAERMALSETVRDAVRAQLEQRTGVTFEALDVRHYGPKLRVPALVVHDRDDRHVPFAVGEHVAQHWAGARLHATSGLGHFRVLRDAAVVQLAVEFVTRFPAELEPPRDFERALALDVA